MKDEITLREVLVLNNSTLLRVVYNKISAIDVLVTFSPSNIPYVLLNEFNFGMITFTSKTDKNYRNNRVNSIKITDPKPISESLLSNISKPEHYDLKYVSKSSILTLIILLLILVPMFFYCLIIKNVFSIKYKVKLF